MATALLNPILCRATGRIGDMVIRQVNGRAVISRSPRKSTREPTAAQLANQMRFREAAAYAHTALDNPPAREFYTSLAVRQKTSAHTVARRDFLNPPVIDDIALALYQGHPEDEILVHAHDDTEVVSVSVTIKDMLGRVIEQGQARLWQDVWIYDATTTAPAGQPLTITATAMDRPGNEVTRTAPWIPGTTAESWLPQNGHGATRCRVIT